MTRRVASTAVQVAAGLFLVLGAAVFSAWADDPPIREFFLGPFSFPRGIALGPDCNLWFTEAGTNKIGKITPEGAITEYLIPTSNSVADGIALGADGNLWFTEGNTNKIGQITPTGGITEFTIPTPGAGPVGITSGPDGALWFTERNGNIWRITTAGQFTEFSVPTPGSGITRGPDGNLWFTAANKIGRITPTGAVTEFAIPTPDSGPAGITSGPDGALWFTELIGNKIGRITTAGAITEFPIPTSASQPLGIAPGPDGNLWFTERGANKIGQITPAGMITELTRLVTGPHGITPGPGGLWFTENIGAAIGQIMVGSGSPDFTLSALPASQTVTPGGATSYGVTINPTNCFSGQVTLTVSDLPSGANGDFSPNPATASSTFSVTTSASTPTGTYPLTITGVSGGLTHTAMVSLVVSPGDFALSASPASQTVTPGGATSYGVTINPMGGFSGPVTLTVSGLPSGANGDFSPNPATASSTLSVTTSASTPTGTYPLTITGVSDGLMHTAMVSLVVSTAGSLVVNGGFETGDFTGWTQGGNLDATFVRSTRPHSGQFAAELGPVFSQGFLSQTVPTVAGTTYDFDFWLRADSNLPLVPRNVFQVSLNGVVVFTEIIRALGHDYQLHSFSFVATGPTTLRFDFRHDFGFFTLDDVSVRAR